jgi:hypothetical protein
MHLATPDCRGTSMRIAVTGRYAGMAEPRPLHGTQPGSLLSGHTWRQQPWILFIILSMIPVLSFDLPKRIVNGPIRAGFRTPGAPSPWPSIDLPFSEGSYSRLRPRPDAGRAESGLSGSSSSTGC